MVLGVSSPVCKINTNSDIWLSVPSVRFFPLILRIRALFFINFETREVLGHIDIYIYLLKRFWFRGLFITHSILLLYSWIKNIFNSWKYRFYISIKKTIMSKPISTLTVPFLFPCHWEKSSELIIYIYI